MFTDVYADDGGLDSADVCAAWLRADEYVNEAR